ncbi:hypothetical protein BES34_007440 [Leptospira inadai serovar Lyme]|uniref:Uncharacterized protein n=1 Tax=Leptospira inadai serovar Lyme TaxID=293084 RepID=A0ABX4YJN5_9LEPT|nr:hypothetical protein BES34_007440 [Leptospira inadai serovar Lyme]
MPFTGELLNYFVGVIDSDESICKAGLTPQPSHRFRIARQPLTRGFAKAYLRIPNKFYST